MLAGPWPIIPDTNTFGVARPANIRLASFQNSPHRHSSTESVTLERSEHLRSMLPRAHDSEAQDSVLPQPYALELDSFLHVHPGPAAKVPWTYEERTARFYLSICGLFPILLPLYIFGSLDFIMRVHTCGQYRQFPAREKRMATGILIAWLVLVAGAVPAITILRSGWWATG